MIRRPPRSTRTDTLCPYTTLFRAPFHCPLMQAAADAMAEALDATPPVAPLVPLVANVTASPVSDAVTIRDLLVQQVTRSEERRVGKECVSTCRSRWSPYH